MFDMVEPNMFGTIDHGDMSHVHNSIDYADANKRR
jgi:hypothetical protein